MADMYLGESAGPETVSGSGVVGSLFNWAGALMSVALVGGLGMWGYDLLMRDVTGVPVVRALEGPMRIAPDDPGGEQAEHQGLAVNSVAADGAVEGPAPRLVLAPPPLDLADEDLPAPDMTGGETAAEADPMPELTESDVVELADAIAEGVTPLSAPTPEPEISDEAIPASVRGVSRSPFPVPRPGVTTAFVTPTVAENGTDPVAEAIVATVDLSAPAPSVEIDPSEVVAGTRLVQFGAFASPEEARAEWRRLDQRFTDFFRGKNRVIEKAISGGKTFYRLRAMGFADISEARRFCSAFVAERQACIPVVAR